MNHAIASWLDVLCVCLATNVHRLFVELRLRPSIRPPPQQEEAKEARDSQATTEHDPLSLFTLDVKDALLDSAAQDKSVDTGSASPSNTATTQPKSSEPLEVWGIVYTGIFLSPTSQAALLQRFPALYSEYADHVTLRYFGGRGCVSSTSFPIGRLCQVKVLRHVHNHRGQAVEVRILDPEVAALCEKTW